VQAVWTATHQPRLVDMETLILRGELEPRGERALFNDVIRIRQHSFAITLTLRF
jgi:hypothetical protein